MEMIYPGVLNRWIPMSLPDEQEPDPVIRTALTTAVGGVCEWFHEKYPLSHFEIHRIYREEECPDRVPDDPRKGILVLCPLCRRLIHEDPGSRRGAEGGGNKPPGPGTEAARMIPGYTSRPYTPRN
jgi:hypothetical protein